jgi:hypothetical protein
VETSGVASEPGVASISRAAQAMDIDTDSEQTTQSQTESTQYSTRSLCNTHNSTFVIHSVCYFCNKCILQHKTFISFLHFYTHLDVFTQKSFGSISKILPTPFFNSVSYAARTQLLLLSLQHPCWNCCLLDLASKLATCLESFLAAGRHGIAVGVSVMAS